MYKTTKKYYLSKILSLTALGLYLLCYLFSGVQVLAQSDFYIDPNGSDSNAGTLQLPFKTIQKCADIATLGDRCIIRAGTYRETITPANSGVTFTNYNNEKAIISGNEIIPNNSFSNYSGDIYQAPMNWNMNVRTWEQTTNNQIFVDGKMMVEARWPNIPVENVTNITNQVEVREDDARADSATNLQAHSATYLDSALQNVPSGLFDGGKINFGVGTNMIHTTCDVNTQTQTQVDFACNPDVDGSQTTLGTDQTGDNGLYYTPRKGNYFYLWGKLEALDNQGEWFWKDNTLSLMMPDGSNPINSNSVIEARKRAYAFNLTGKSNTTIDGLEIFAGGIKTDSNTNNSLIQNIKLQYLWHFQEIRPMWLNWQGTKGFEIKGNNNTIKDSYFAYSAGSMISMADNTSSNKIINNVIRDVAYMGSDVAVSASNNQGGTNKHLVQNNTIFNTGRYIIDPVIGDVKYNDVYNSHLQINDLGNIYSWGTDGNGAEIAYNYVHDNHAELDNDSKYFGGFGIYLDDDTYNYKVYRNIVWNTSNDGIFSYGTNGTVVTQYPETAQANRLIYNNSVSGKIGADAKSDYRGRPQNLNGTIYKNNLADTFYINTSKGAISENNFTNPGYIDPNNGNLNLKSYSIGIDAGQNLGSPYMDAPMAPINQPDSGAIEYGKLPFVAGALILPPDVPNLTATCNSLATSASCTITNIPFGRKPGSDFSIKIGNGTESTCVNQTNYQTHLTTANCSNLNLPNTTSATQDVFVKSSGTDWVKIGSINISSTNISSVSPANGPTTGNTPITISGSDFSNKKTYSKDVTISNTNTTKLSDYPLLIEVDTASLIQAGKLKNDCGDLRFSDQYSELTYWLEDGCDTTKTRFWVKVPNLPIGSSQLKMTYGDLAKTLASNPKNTFTFFDDFSGTTLGNNYWIQPNLNTTSTTIDLYQGQIRIAGSSTDITKYDGYYFNLQNISFPQNFAIDSKMSVLNGPSVFKSAAGTGAISVVGTPSNGGKPLAYWNGSNWANVGNSKINSGTFDSKKISVAYLGDTTNRTVTWSEDGEKTVLASRTGLNNPGIGGFYYGPDAIFSNFDARFDDIIVRQTSPNEPTATFGNLETSNSTTVKIDGLDCSNVTIASNGSSITCNTSAHSAGKVPVTIYSYDGQSYIFYNYEYIDVQSGSTTLLPTDIASLNIGCNESLYNAVTTCNFVLPPNKTLPSDFKISIGTGAINQLNCNNSTTPNTPGCNSTNSAVAQACTLTSGTVTCNNIPTGNSIGNIPIYGQFTGIAGSKTPTGETVNIVGLNFGGVTWTFTPNQGGTAPLFRNTDDTTININNFKTILDPTPTSNTRYTCNLEYRKINDRLATTTPTWTTISTTPTPYTTGNTTNSGCSFTLTKAMRLNNLNYSLRLTITDTAITNPNTTTNPNTYTFYNEYIYRFQGAGVASGG